MESNKITTNNPLVNPNKMRQKLVTVADYNQLWDDTEAVEAKTVDLQDQIDNLPTGPTLESDWGASVTAGLLLTAIDKLQINVFEHLLTNDACVRLVDFIKAVHYTGNAVVEYSYSLDGGISWSVPVTDPTLEILHWEILGGGDACNSLGTQAMQIKASDGQIVDSIANTALVISDNGGIC